MKKIISNITLAFLFLFVSGNLFSQVYTFTNCGATGRFGPTQAQVNATYTGPNPLTGNVTVNTQGIQEWVVPATGPYSIEVRGAKGQDSPTFQAGGPGITIRGDFNLVAGQVLKIAVGQIGEPTSDNEGAGGGGGSFVTDIANTPLIIAGGGGGGARTSGPTTPAVAGTTAQNGHWGGGGGTAGSGGNCGPCSSIGGGGGGGGVKFTSRATEVSLAHSHPPSHNIDNTERTAHDVGSHGFSFSLAASLSLNSGITSDAKSSSASQICSCLFRPPC